MVNFMLYLVAQLLFKCQFSCVNSSQGVQRITSAFNQMPNSFWTGSITICPDMNINFLFVGGASIFAKFLS